MGTDTDRLQSLPIDYKTPQKVGHGLQSLLIDYKRLQKSDRPQSLLTNYKDYRVDRLQRSLIDYRRIQKSELDYKVY